MYLEVGDIYIQHWPDLTLTMMIYRYGVDNLLHIDTTREIEE